MPTKEIPAAGLRGAPRLWHDFESADAQTGEQPDPAYSDELHPPSPFAELLRRAYVPTLDPREVPVMTLLERPRPENQAEAVSKRIDAMAERRQHEVVQPFMDDLDG